MTPEKLAVSQELYNEIIELKKIVARMQECQVPQSVRAIDKCNHRWASIDLRDDEEVSIFELAYKMVLEIRTKKLNELQKRFDEL